MVDPHAFVHRLHNPDFGILLLRVALGTVFIYHGWAELVSIETPIGFFASLGLSPFLAYTIAAIEFIGGIAFIVGIFSRYFGPILAAIMAVAILKVHFANGFSIANNGYEFAFVLMLGSLAMATFGSGAYSLAKFIRG